MCNGVGCLWITTSLLGTSLGQFLDLKDANDGTIFHPLLVCLFLLFVFFYSIFRNVLDICRMVLFTLQCVADIWSSIHCVTLKVKDVSLYWTWQELPFFCLAPARPATSDLLCLHLVMLGIKCLRYAPRLISS